jgi:hypothetical protein
MLAFEKLAISTLSSMQTVLHTDSSHGKQSNIIYLLDLRLSVAKGIRTKRRQITANESFSRHLAAAVNIQRAETTTLTCRGFVSNFPNDIKVLNDNVVGKTRLGRRI